MGFRTICNPLLAIMCFRTICVALGDLQAAADADDDGSFSL